MDHQKNLSALTAGDLMTRGLVALPQDMSLQSAARLLSGAHVSGAPVVDERGRCVGVISTTDFLHWVEQGSTKIKPAHSICQSWQIIGNEAAPTDTVRCFMTADPVVVPATTGIGALAQMMLDARIHRIIVVDQTERPIGIVSATDFLAAIVRETRSHEGHHAPANECPIPVAG